MNSLYTMSNKCTYRVKIITYLVASEISFPCRMEVVDKNKDNKLENDEAQVVIEKIGISVEAAEIDR